ncbi:fungal specific transcription factor domain-containing protein [Colletotrichum graminicola]|uniref:Fungal specific transcription factor domain-containing protein n=1 Tax=Colletotrichum graminicola (strain M1.001 / M2 / FGSC 10212) TaxID=645133 RepID=E3Q3Y6_COLGM|nr:fungal specific transcription factor domain-containing protein [Colletotrichum graminicola M1.001]EFQ25738.1 fungal specific transcription factor domain-containing protein [Colletotrichum graminicola M1.001]WDK10909.1 fungal specific transcription factor domain-containing protein [Colletotrichum graminicola]
MPSGSVSRIGACLRCHRRKVKCDRTRPSCAPCARISVQCTYAAREHQIQLRRQDVERLQQHIRDLQAENDNLTGRLAGLQQQPQQAVASDRVATPNSTSSLGLQSEESQVPAGGGEIASQVIHLSLNAGGGRDFVGSTSGVFLANLLQSNSQSIGSSHHVVRQHPSSASRHLNRPSSLATNGVSNLPPKSFTAEILDAYCSHDRLCYPFLSPKALDRALDAVYGAKNPEAVDPVDGFLIDMTLAIGTPQVHKLNWNGIWDAEVHYNRAMTRLGDVFSRAGITALQALLLICQFQMGTTSHDTSTSVWHLIGVAARTCFELGLHKASTYAPPPACDGDERDIAAWKVDIETKRRCFWSVVSMDRIASLILGRPLAIQLEDIDVDLPYFDTSTSVQLHHSLSTASFGTPEWHLETSIFVHIVRYRLICGKILNLLHRSTSANRESTITYEDSRNAVVEELRSWSAETANIPLIPVDAPTASLASRSSFRSAEWYKLLYHNGILMLFRPSSTLCDATGNSTVLQHMFDSSQEAINLYASLHRSRKINYTWVTLHSIFIAGLSYIYALRNHLQHAQNRSVSNTATPKVTLRATPTIGQVVNDTRACSKVLVAVSERDAVVADIVEAQTGRASTSTGSTYTVQPTSEVGGHTQVSSMELNTEDAIYAQSSHSFVNMTVDETLRDCFGDLQSICYDQHHSDAISQLSQDWLYGTGETPSRYF